MTELINSIYRQIQLWDTKIILEVVSWRTDLRTKFFKMMSVMGDGWWWAILGIIVWYFVGFNSDWLKMCLTAFAIELIFYKFIKLYTTRRRPYQRYKIIENLVEPIDKFSFPSGHTAAATVAAMVFSYAFSWIIPVAVLVVILIGFSRIYLGVHYLSDVIIGFLLGQFSFWIGFWIFSV